MADRIAKLWGSELILVNNEHYCVKILTIEPGFAGSLHHHKLKDETFYIESGACILELDSSCTPRRMERGDHQQIRPGRIHRFSNPFELYPCVIIECSTHHDDADTFRLVESKALR